MVETMESLAEWMGRPYQISNGVFWFMYFSILLLYWMAGDARSKVEKLRKRLWRLL